MKGGNKSPEQAPGPPLASHTPPPLWASSKQTMHIRLPGFPRWPGEARCCVHRLLGAWLQAALLLLWRAWGKRKGDLGDPRSPGIWLTGHSFLTNIQTGGWHLLKPSSVTSFPLHLCRLFHLNDLSPDAVSFLPVQEK